MRLLINHETAMMNSSRRDYVHLPTKRAKRRDKLSAPLDGDEMNVWDEENWVKFCNSLLRCSGGALAERVERGEVGGKWVVLAFFFFILFAV